MGWECSNQLGRLPGSACGCRPERPLPQRQLHKRAAYTSIPAGPDSGSLGPLLS